MKDQVFSLILSNECVFILKNTGDNSSVIAARYDRKTASEITIREMYEWLEDTRNYTEKESTQ